jgi:hypothetical protein
LRKRIRVIAWLVTHSAGVGTLVACLLLVSAGWMFLEPRHDRGAAACLPLSLTPLQGLQTCYPAIELPMAERRFPVRRLNPIAVVAPVAHLPLVEAYIYQYAPLSTTFVPPAKQPVVMITYVFGSSMGRMEQCTSNSSAPLYLAVDEIAGHVGQERISSVGSDVSSNLCRLWNVAEVNRAKGIQFSVSSNLPRDTVLLIARRIEHSS